MTEKLLNGFYFLCGSLLILFCTSCNEFDSFGSDLLDDDWIHANGVDTFTLFARSADQDSTITFKTFSTLGAINFGDVAFPLGKMDDPKFGKVTAGIGTQVRMIATNNLSFLNSPIDSIILSLRYDTSLFYGKYDDPMNPMSFHVYPLTEPYDYTQTYFSNHKLKYDQSKKLGEKVNYIPSKKDSLLIKEDTLDIGVYAQLRLALDTMAFMSILRSYDTLVYNTLDSFSKVFNGIAILCDQGNGIISVLPEHNDSKITIYYHSTPEPQSKMEMNMGVLAVKTPVYEIDNSNTTAGDCIAAIIPGDSLLCTQGFNGRDIRITIPYNDSWNGKFINFAVLQFNVADLAGDDISNYSLPGLLEIFDISSGYRVAIDDVALGLNSLTAYTRIFGGNPVLKEINGTSVYQYRMNITRHFQKSLKSKQPMDLIISPLFKLESPARALFYGQGNSQVPLKFILTYSE